VDSERILTQLRLEGYELVGDYDGAELVIINTCGFIDAAVEESMDAIDEALERNGRVIVTGCLGARADMLRDTFPQILAITGPHDYRAVMDSVHAQLPPRHDPFTDLVPPQGLRLTPPHYAWLKISEGCNHRCSFCIIPSMRGRLRSRPIKSVLDEARVLVDAGVKELLVISQDTSAYGSDLRYRPDIVGTRMLRTHIQDLAAALGELGVWVRLHYVYPYPHVDQLVPLMRDGLLLPYLDVPFQHASPAVLKRMRRPANSENVLERVQAWRAICPDLTVRSTFIVGFPGETEADFDQLLEFLREARINRAGCFMYSAVEGARANELDGALPEHVKRERYHEFMRVQAELSADLLDEQIGRRITVLIDEIGANGPIARSSADAPDIDGQVHIEIPAGSAEGVPAVGEFVTVEVTDADEHDLFARLV
ncbi:MAG: 30S ribosomal protein S12 methylthiotransferase RimO, partial [Gammaproteobacteria bacterium]|nr:30S ribosomal protein S12 methylthiotransferase RimO [Gammaproteobacteria bacterium]